MVFGDEWPALVSFILHLERLAAAYDLNWTRHSMGQHQLTAEFLAFWPRNSTLPCSILPSLGSDPTKEKQSGRLTPIYMATTR
jgi:hypothetical protein